MRESTGDVQSPRTLEHFPMADEFLGDRKKALEDSFFAKENAKLVERLRAEKE